MLVEDNSGKITELMSELEQLAWFTEPGLGQTLEWSPRSPEAQALWSQLLDQANRAGLRAWYGRLRGTELNPHAAALKQRIERDIGEPLD